MTSEDMLKASLVLVAGLLPFVADPPPVQADAAVLSAYDYRRELGYLPIHNCERRDVNEINSRRSTTRSMRFLFEPRHAVLWPRGQGSHTIQPRDSR